MSLILSCLAAPLAITEKRAAGGALCRRNTDERMGAGPISFQTQSTEGSIMKSLSFFVTLLLLATANQLAAHMRKSGSLPAEKFAPKSTNRSQTPTFKR